MITGFSNFVKIPEADGNQLGREICNDAERDKKEEMG